MWEARSCAKGATRATGSRLAVQKNADDKRAVVLPSTSLRCQPRTRCRSGASGAPPCPPCTPNLSKIYLLSGFGFRQCSASFNWNCMCLPTQKLMSRSWVIIRLIATTGPLHYAPPPVQLVCRDRAGVPFVAFLKINLFELKFNTSHM